MQGLRRLLKPRPKADSLENFPRYIGITGVNTVTGESKRFILPVYEVVGLMVKQGFEPKLALFGYLQANVSLLAIEHKMRFPEWIIQTDEVDGRDVERLEMEGAEVIDTRTRVEDVSGYEDDCEGV